MQSSTSFKQQFYKGVFTYLAAGIELHAALGFLANNGSKDIRDVSGRIADQILLGNTFSNAMKLSGRFSLYEVHTMTAAEEGSGLTSVCEALHTHYLNQLKFRKEFLKNSAYPALVFIGSLLVMIGMLIFVVPMFEGIYSNSSNGSVPLITKSVVWLSHHLLSIFIVILITLNLCAFTLYFLLKSNPTIRKLEELVFRMPVFGQWIKSAENSRFFSILGLLLNNGLSLQKAILLSADTLSTATYTSKLNKILDELVLGTSLYESMKKLKLFDEMSLQLIRNGEQTSQLNRTFKELAILSSGQLKERGNMILTMLEPALIIATGIMVASILIALYLPMFQVGSFIQ